jgi:AcrR family transcriptional regulator
MLSEVTEATRPVSRVERKRQTRRRLLKAAARVFAGRGIVAARTVDVAEAAGVSHGTVFVHFPTRDELVSEVVAGCVGRAARRIHEASGDGLEVREVLEAHLAAIGEDEALYARLVMEAPLLPEGARHTLLGVQSAISHHLGKAVRREIDAGRLREVPLPFLFNTWLGLVNHYLANRDLFAPGGSVVERHGEWLVSHFLGLLTP